MNITENYNGELGYLVSFKNLQKIYYNSFQ